MAAVVILAGPSQLANTYESREESRRAQNLLTLGYVPMPKSRRRAMK